MCCVYVCYCVCMRLHAIHITSIGGWHAELFSLGGLVYHNDTNLYALLGSIFQAPGDSEGDVTLVAQLPSSMADEGRGEQGVHEGG